MRDCKKSLLIPISLCWSCFGTKQTKTWNPVGHWNCIKCWAFWHEKALDSLEEETGREHVSSRGFEAGPFMSAVIIVRLKVCHTLWACLHKELACPHCEGRLAGWEYNGRAKSYRARHGLTDTYSCFLTHQYSLTHVCLLLAVVPFTFLLSCCYFVLPVLLLWMLLFLYYVMPDSVDR